MPRGRKDQTPLESKKDSLTRILNALIKSPSTFSSLKKTTGLHQNTLSKWLKELISNGHAYYDKVRREYSISVKGNEESCKRMLIDLLEKAKEYTVVGGPGSNSIYPADKVIRSSTIGYSFPGINRGSLKKIKNLVHKYVVLQMLSSLAYDYRIDPRYLTDEKPLNGLLDNLKTSLKPEKHILALIIDYQTIIKSLNIEYLKEILSIADLEKEYKRDFRRYANEIKSIEFLKQRKRARLEDISEKLEIDRRETQNILDNLLVEDEESREMEIYDKKGKFMQKIQLDSNLQQEIHSHEGKILKVRLVKNKAFLKRTLKGQNIYYEIA